METFLNIFGLIIIIIIFLPILLGGFGIDIFGIDNNKNRASFWYASILILPLLFYVFSNYNKGIDYNNKVAKCVLNFNYYGNYTKNELINNYNKYCNNKNSNSEGCFRFSNDFSSSISGIGNNMTYECLKENDEIFIKSKIIDCINSSNIFDEIEDLRGFNNKNGIDNFYKFLHKIEEVEKSAKNCVYIYK